ncbi:DUF3841 domain-containing protein [Pandoraea communis]|nr:DUF3841 domain-containing protein [Pandoraea communis]
MPTVDSHTQLWTFQHIAQLNALLRDGVVYGDWKNIDPACEEAYRYMCRVMGNYGLDCGDAPPIWAWHSCCAAGKAPDSEVATQLLSLSQLAENNIVLLSLACPDDQYLLSDYHQWCDWVYFPSLADESNCILEMTRLEDDEKAHRVFGVDLTSVEDDLVQATLPIVRKEWLRQVHRVELGGEGVQFRRFADAIGTDTPSCRSSFA